MMTQRVDAINRRETRQGELLVAHIISPVNIHRAVDRAIIATVHDTAIIRVNHTITRPLFEDYLKRLFLASLAVDKDKSNFFSIALP